MEIDFRAQIPEAVHQFEGGGFPHIIDVRLVSEPEHEDAAAFDRLAARVERFHGAVDDIFRHRAVDFAGQLDEAGVYAELAGFPCQIERIDRDAMAAEAGSGVERSEPEGFGGGGADHFPDIYVHGIGHDLQLVDQADVHRAEDVFEQFGEFGHTGRADRHDLIEGRAVEGD